jgi:hypothetical protein
MFFETMTSDVFSWQYINTRKSYGVAPHTVANLENADYVRGDFHLTIIQRFIDEHQQLSPHAGRQSLRPVGGLEIGWCGTFDFRSLLALIMHKKRRHFLCGNDAFGFSVKCAV